MKKWQRGDWCWVPSRKVWCLWLDEKTAVYIYSDGILAARGKIISMDEEMIKVRPKCFRPLTDGWRTLLPYACDETTSLEYPA